MGKLTITISRGVKKLKIINEYYPDLIYVPHSILRILAPLLKKNTTILGWGYNDLSNKALKIANKNNLIFYRLEDGPIRSYDIGSNDEMSHSFIADKKGIYYDTSSESDFQDLCKEEPFTEMSEKEVSETIQRIINNSISKYNNLSKKSNLDIKKNSVLFLDQIKGDNSLKFGKAENISTESILKDIKKRENNATIYIKVHPATFNDKSLSSLDLDLCEKNGCILIDSSTDNFSLLNKFNKVYTKTSQLGFESILLDKEVITYGIPFYSQYGLTTDLNKEAKLIKKLNKEALFYFMYIKYSHYYSFLNERGCDINKALDSIIFFKEHFKKTNQDLNFFGFSSWKKSFLKDFFLNYRLVNRKYTKKSNFLKIDPTIKNVKWSESEEFEFNSPITVEDGFLRSSSLGSDLTTPYSLVVDTEGIYFNPEKISEFETKLINKKALSEYEHRRITNFIENLQNNKITKYSIRTAKLSLKKQADKKYILIPGQVADDASIKYGGLGLTIDQLISKVRSKNTEAHIIFKPHPDVLSGNREGVIHNSDCDYIAKNENLQDLIDLVDEVHVLTSLVGFESLLAGKTTYVYGHPFYCGWGLSKDMSSSPMRRVDRTLEQLAYVAYIDYPVYSYKGKYRTPEYILNILIHQKNFPKKEFRVLKNTKRKIIKTFIK